MVKLKFGLLTSESHFNDRAWTFASWIFRLPDIQDNAVRIFSQYISLEAPDSIGVDQDMRKQILDNMCQEDEQVGVDCFRAAQDKIFEILNDKCVCANSSATDWLVVFN